MSYPINYPTPQSTNIQIFSVGGSSQDWIKPQGASFVWFTLIGAGGGGSAGAPSGANPQSGGAGAITNFMGPAFLMPDKLRVTVGAGGKGNPNLSGQKGGDTTIIYQEKDESGYTLLTAGGGFGGSFDQGGTALSGTVMEANQFTCMGFFQSISGNTNTTSFLTGGGATNSTVTSSYGYATNRDGYFQMQPIIVGVGGGAGANAGQNGNKGGVGCGGGSGNIDPSIQYGGDGGNGLVVVITW